MKTKKILILPLIIVYVLFIQSVFTMYSADVHHTASEKALNKGLMEEAFYQTNKSIDNNPYEPAYYRQRAKILVTYTLNTNEEEKNKIKNLALQDMETAYRINPENMATLRNNAPLYMLLAVKNLTENVNEENIDEKYAETTKVYFRSLKEKYPTDVGVFVLTAKLEQRLGFEEDYKVSVKKIEELRPDLLEWHEDLIN